MSHLEPTATTVTTGVPAPERPASPAPSVHDARRYWRVLLAVIVPLPWLAKGIQYIVVESNDVPSAELIRRWTTDHTYAWLQWLDVLFVVLVVPSVVALGIVSRRGAPRLAAAAMTVMGGGFLMVLPLNMGGDPMIWAAARGGFDPTSTGAFLDSLENDPRIGLGGLGFIVAITVGSLLIGLALWRSRAVSTLAAALVGLGGLTHPFLSFDHRVHGAGLVLLAVGSLAVSRRLVTQADDEFDLPPLPLVR